jgi:uncharacterized protein (DUF1800 family)
VLGAAAASGAAAAAVRLLPWTQTALGGHEQWVSPLGSEKARVAHLLRRATLGATMEQFEQAASRGFSRTVDQLLESPPAPPPAFPAARDPGVPQRLNVGQLQLWWVEHMLNSPTPFAERMTLFWHGHFTSDYRKVGLMTPFIHWQNLTWRDMALTDLRSMLMRVTTDPAMLRYLDLATSTGQSPNENYARELMELFSLGVGRYTEDDVRAASRALAGWVEPRPDGFANVTLDAKNGVTRRYPTYANPAVGVHVSGRAYQGGPLTFLGRRANFDTQAVIDQILAQPAAAYFIAGKVAEHYLGGSVEASYVRWLGDKFRSSRYDVKTLMHALFTSSEFTAAQSYRALVKAPVEMMVHALKALGATQLGRLVVQASPNMGQVLFDPPDVGGWPNNQAWISSNNVIARVNFVSGVLRQVRALPHAQEAVVQLDGVFGPQTAAFLNKAADDQARWLLALVSPEFQLK